MLHKYNCVYRLLYAIVMLTCTYYRQLKDSIHNHLHEYCSRQWVIPF